MIATHRRDTIPDTLAELSGLHDNVRVETMDVTVEEQVFVFSELAPFLFLSHVEL